MRDTILPGAGRPASISIPRLRAAFNGRVIAPDDAGYDRARTVFLGDIDRRPAVIIRPADATDVSRVISLATETGLELAVRSGGHSAAGHSVNDGASCSTSRTCGGWTSIPNSGPPGPRRG